MQVILISATGLGAGKTTLAQKFTTLTVSLADQIRAHLAQQYPNINFYNKSQEYKNMIFDNTGGRTVRELLIEFGTHYRKTDPDVWVNLAIKKIKTVFEHNPKATVAIDDIRYLNELHRFREEFGSAVTHLHISEESATKEPQYQNEELEKVADYVVRRG